MISLFGRAVDIGENQHGKMITTCVMEETDRAAEDDFDDLDFDLSPQHKIALKVLRKNKVNAQEVTISIADFKDQLRGTKGFFEGRSDEGFRKAFKRAWDKLRDKEGIQIDEENQTITLS